MKWKRFSRVCKLVCKHVQCWITEHWYTHSTAHSRNITHTHDKECLQLVCLMSNSSKNFIALFFLHLLFSQQTKKKTEKRNRCSKHSNCCFIKFCAFHGFNEFWMKLFWVAFVLFWVLFYFNNIATCWMGTLGHTTQPVAVSTNGMKRMNNSDNQQNKKQK